MVKGPLDGGELLGRFPWEDVEMSADGEIAPLLLGKPMNSIELSRNCKLELLTIKDVGVAGLAWQCEREGS